MSSTEFIEFLVARPAYLRALPLDCQQAVSRRNAKRHLLSAGTAAALDSSLENKLNRDVDSQLIRRIRAAFTGEIPEYSVLDHDSGAAAREDSSSDDDNDDFVDAQETLGSAEENPIPVISDHVVSRDARLNSGDDGEPAWWPDGMAGNAAEAQ